MPTNELTKSNRQRRIEVAICKFRRMVNSGRDYTTNYMYKCAADDVYASVVFVKKVIQDYYRGLVTDEMKSFIKTFSSCHEDNVSRFANEFKMKPREARLMITYVKRSS